MDIRGHGICIINRLCCSPSYAVGEEMSIEPHLEGCRSRTRFGAHVSLCLPKRNKKNPIESWVAVEELNSHVRQWGDAYIYIHTHIHVFEQRSKGHHADMACMFRGSRKFRDDIRERKVTVSRKFNVTHVVKISVSGNLAQNFAIDPR